MPMCLLGGTSIKVEDQVFLSGDNDVNLIMLVKSHMTRAIQCVEH
jgi:hypothetical protein